MILFRAKANGQVTTTPSLVPQGSSMQDLVVLSELDYALCTVKLQPASGIYIPDIVCDIIETSNKTTLWTAKLPPEAARVSGIVRYQLLFTASDGTQLTTLSGTFNVPRGAITNMPESVEDLSQRNINEIYTLLANVYTKYLDVDGNVEKLLELISTTTPITILSTQWTDTTPYTALIPTSGIEAGTVALFIPEDDATKEVAGAARMSMKIDSTEETGVGGQYVVFARADGGTAPAVDLHFRCIIIKTGSEDEAVVAMIGVDAYGTGAGIDEARVNELIKEALEDLTLPEGGSGESGSEGITVTSGTVSISATDWDSETPYEVKKSVGDLASGTVTTITPADELTKLTAEGLALHVVPVLSDGMVVFQRSENSITPRVEMTFRYTTIPTDAEADALLSLVGINTNSVESVNGKAGTVELTASDVGAYTKEETNDLVSKLPKFTVAVLPQTEEGIYYFPDVADASLTTVYLWPVLAGDDEMNICQEYICVEAEDGNADSRRWELLGQQTIDLTSYVKRSDSWFAFIPKVDGVYTFPDANTAEERTIYLKPITDPVWSMNQYQKFVVVTKEDGTKAWEELSVGRQELNAYVKTTALSEAVETEVTEQLTAAKESGEFDGKSAYQIWLDAGNTGTEAEFLESLKGKDGADAESAAVPDYIVTEAERVAAAVQSVRTAKTLVFPVMSDFHLFDGNSNHENSLISAQYAGMGIGELKKRLHLDLTAYLGDFTWGADTHTVAQVKQDINAVKETADTTGAEVWCIGNHDLNYGANRDRLMTLDEIYSYICANSDGVKPYDSIERGYGYLDFESQKLRVIYLNTCDASDWVATDGEKARAEWIGPAQMQWLADTALDFSAKAVPSEWGIVIVGHHPLHYGYNCFEATMQIFEGYKDGTSGKVYNTIDGTTHTISFDFTSGEKAEIICNIHGHNHNCGYSKISSSSWNDSTDVTPWLWRFCIPNISANRYNTGAEVAERYGEYDENGNAISWTKETGTAKATSFCVVSIDRKNKYIYAHIFGAGKDRIMYYGAEELATYTVTNNLTNCTSSNSATTVEEGSAYNATITANSGYVLDSVTATMGGEAVTVTDGTISIASVTGDIVITATASEEQTGPAYTNQLPISTDTDGSIYNGTGYKADTKLSSSTGAATGASGYVLTGFIPIGHGSSRTATGEQVIYLSGVEALPTDNNVRIAFYKADKTFIGLKAANTFVTSSPDTQIYYTLGSDGYINMIDASAVTGYYFNGSSDSIETAYFRLSAPGIDGDSIITVNEEIVE